MANQISQKVTKLGSWSLGLEAKPLAGVQGVEFLAAPNRVKPY